MSLNKPDRQLTSVGVGGAFAIVLVWILGLFNVEMPMEVAAASSVILAWLIGYFTPAKKESHD